MPVTKQEGAATATDDPVAEIGKQIEVYQRELDRLNSTASFAYTYLVVAAPTLAAFLLLIIISQGLLDFTTGITAALFFSLLITCAYLVITQPAREEKARQLQHQIRRLDRQQRNLASGRRGEQEVAFALQWLPKEYIVINDIQVASPGLGAQQLDHVVIGPQGVFHLETKNYNGAVIISPDGQWMLLRPGENGLVREGIDSPLAQVRRHEMVLRQILGSLNVGREVPLVSLVVLSHPRCIMEGRDPELTVLKKDHLVSYITDYQNAAKFSARQVRRIALALVRAGTASGTAAGETDGG
ncbi:MAG: NERD domain-containing protein [Clostridia bacterium]|nr:MAG: NERD domain-containing protein [Clostridia bacterium]